MNRTKQKVQREPNPVLKANWFSKFTFWWMKDIYRIGLKRSLHEDDLYTHNPLFDSQQLTDKFSQLWDDELKRKNPSVLRVIARAYGWPTIPLGLLFSITETINRAMQPLCLGGLVGYFAPGQTDTSRTEAYIYAGGIVVSSVIPVVTFHPFFFHLVGVATKIRVSISGLMYRKCLEVSKSATNDGMSSRAINILSNDLSKFDVALAFLHDLWKGPLESLLLGYLMYREIQIAAVIGVAFMLSFIPIQAWGAKKAAGYRLKTAERTDIRVKLMNEIIQGIQVIKMYAWEKSFARVIGEARRKEINAIRGTSYIYAALSCTTMIAKFSIFLSLATFVYFGNEITARKVFIVSTYFSILNESMVHFWPLAITFCAEAFISARRAKEFLMDGDARLQKGKKPAGQVNYMKNSNGVHVNGSTVTMNGSAKVPRRIVKVDTDVKNVVIRNGTASWDGSGDNSNAAISDCNVDIQDKSLVAICGPIGAGKTTFLNVLLGEVTLTDGEVTVNGALSYAAQEPWLFEGTVRDNIVFVEEYDSKRYKRVIRACALERDLELLPHGDATIVGERGISLSGGQKARVNLARAVYRKADIYLLDDPLSAVDSHVGKHIYENCIKHFLSDKIRILVTHQLQYLQDVEHLILMNSGRIDAQGSYKELQSSMKFEILKQSHHESESGDNEAKKRLPKNDSERSLSKPYELEDEDAGEDGRKESQAVGSVKFQVYKSYFNSLGSPAVLLLILGLFIIARTMLTGVDYFISRWVIWEEKAASVIASDKSHIPTDTYRENMVIYYSILICATLVVYLMRTYGFFMMCLRISLKLHDKLFNGITRASMQFFNTNPSGRILNRFAKDINSIDAVLPQTLLDCISFFTDVTGVLIIVAIANYWLLFPAILVVIVLYVMRHLYVSTSRSVKRIESISRSPIYSLTNQTFQGLTTIRALKAQKDLETEFHDHQNNNTAAWYLFLATQRSFALWTDIVCILYISMVTFSFLVLQDSFQSGDVGLAIMNCISMIGMCQWGMRQTAELENQMTSVERVLEYVDLPAEAALETSPKDKPTSDWPMKGRLTFDDFKLRYSENDDYVLKELNFAIEPTEKLGIVGRTGAGKSSIIQSIFRLACNEGSIEIDGVNIDKLGLHDLRSKISIIPQDPVLFSGTLRYNLDPFETKSDEELWRALADVELKSYVSTLIGGLNCRMYDGGSNFSMGQRQLVCLARAILRNNKILILDEATANVDPETDKLIQTTIRTKFANCTVLTIAHRLHTVMDSDRVLVMDAGRAVELGHPYDLLQQSDGYLRKLVDQSGQQNAAVLMKTAEESKKQKGAKEE